MPPNVDDVGDALVFTLANSAAKAFALTPDYDTNYSYTYILDYCESNDSRQDLPLPIVLHWKVDTETINTEVRISRADGSKECVYRTTEETIVVYNLVPDTQYNYRITAFHETGIEVLVENGSFVTTPDRTRMLYIDGIQNVRDIGGYMGVDGKSVRYELIYRGSAMDDTTLDNLCISEAGKREMLERIGIGTDLDLRGANMYTESALGSTVDFYAPPSSYKSYANALTDHTDKQYFKNMLEYIVEQLSEYEDEHGNYHPAKPVYIHCQGGCDRTGTVVFLLLGLLGVNESDLAKEYELSSLATIGLYRTRDSVYYDYSGMVKAIKSYGDGGLLQCFEAFAESCGISQETIERFRNIMLE